jgi:multidrug resistance efflux pump
MSCCQSGSIAAARAGVRQVQLEFRQAPAYSADVAVAQVDLLQAGTRPEAIAAAQAEVKATEASLERAPAALKETELRAIFAGTAASLDAQVGELVSPGVPVVWLANLPLLGVLVGQSCYLFQLYWMPRTNYQLPQTNRCHPVGAGKPARREPPL